ncbi:HAD family hydrolase [Flavihumibacter sp. R14]|nr:HAD family hydrolase [Flavihumibacter soli]
MLNLIIDLDNTIYPVKSIGDTLFAPLFDLLNFPEYKLSPDTIEEAKVQIMRIPFQKVAAEFNFPPELTNDAMKLLRSMTYVQPMTYFPGYELIRELHTLKFLLTTGFEALQESKIYSLGIEHDFTEIFIVDPDKSRITKKDVMENIMEKYDLIPESLLVVGDDPESEIKAAKELGIRSFLLDPDNAYADAGADYRGRSLKDVLDYV